MFVDPKGKAYEANITNDSLKVFFKTFGDVLLILSGVSPSSIQELYENVYDVGDYTYIATIIFFSRYYLLFKLENDADNGVFVNEDKNKNDALHFEVCRSFQNKKVCIIVASYLPSKFGATPQEIFAHAVVYYATDYNKNTIINNYSEYAAFEGFGEYMIKFLNNRTDLIDIGHDSNAALKFYDMIWRIK